MGPIVLLLPIATKFPEIFAIPVVRLVPIKFVEVTLSAVNVPATVTFAQVIVVADKKDVPNVENVPVVAITVPIVDTDITALVTNTLLDVKLLLDKLSIVELVIFPLVNIKVPTLRLVFTRLVIVLVPNCEVPDETFANIKVPTLRLVFTRLVIVLVPNCEVPDETFANIKVPTLRFPNAPEPDVIVSAKRIPTVSFVTVKFDVDKESMFPVLHINDVFTIFEILESVPMILVIVLVPNREVPALIFPNNPLAAEIVPNAPLPEVIVLVFKLVSV
jgi:hypothetical protein